MKYDYKFERMPQYRFREVKGDMTKRIWQVVMIERDEIGVPIKDIQVQRGSLTYDEAASVWNELRQELMKANLDKADNK